MGENARHRKAVSESQATDGIPSEVERTENPSVGAEGGPLVEGFETIRFLGRGSHADVWLLRERSSGMFLAFKALRSGEDARSSRVAEREVRLAQCVSHEHLLPHHGVRSWQRPNGEGRGILVDYAPGGSLGRLLASRGRISSAETVTVVASAARGLAALHEAGIVHGDVSPGNILFRVDGKPLLNDFGSSRTVGESPGRDAGTEGFAEARIPPDLALSPASDIYALGAVAWLCLTGRKPPPPDRRPPLPLLEPRLPPDLAAVIDAALDPVAENRPDAGDFCEALLRSVRPLPVDISSSADVSMRAELPTVALAPVRRTRRRQPGVARDSSRRRAPVLSRSRSPRTEGRRGAGQERWGRLLRGMGILLAAAVVSVGAVLGFSTGHGDDRGDDRGDGTGGMRPAASAASSGGPPSPLTPGTMEPPDPLRAVGELAEERARAFSSGNRSAAEAVSVPGSPAALADRELIGLLAGGRRLAGLAVVVREAVLLRRNGEGEGAEARVSLEAESSGYRLENDAGEVLGRRDEDSSRRLVVVLRVHAGKWRVYELLPDEER